MGSGADDGSGEKDMSEIRRCQDLKVWKFAMQSANALYAIARESSKEELYGMTRPMRRASAIVPANIAGGYGRDKTGDDARFLQIAQGSRKEFETLPIRSCEIGIATQSLIDALMAISDRFGCTLRSLIRSNPTRK
jgi:four helix bundle protein